MNIDNKYITIYTGESYFEYPPMFYFDIFRMKPSLKHVLRDCNSIQSGFGLFNFHLCVIINWGWIEREKTKDEKELEERLKIYVDIINAKED